jgi:hypothetical protein
MGVPTKRPVDECSTMTNANPRATLSCQCLRPSLNTQRTSIDIYSEIVSFRRKPLNQRYHLAGQPGHRQDWPEAPGPIWTTVRLTVPSLDFRDDSPGVYNPGAAISWSTGYLSPGLSYVRALAGHNDLTKNLVKAVITLESRCCDRHIPFPP